LKKSHAVVDTQNLFDTNSHWLEKAQNSHFAADILPAGVIRRIERNPAEYKVSLLKVLYLILFEKLILSGEYDDEFGNPQIGDTLEQVFSG